MLQIENAILDNNLICHNTAYLESAFPRETFHPLISHVHVKRTKIVIEIVNSVFKVF